MARRRQTTDRKATQVRAAVQATRTQSTSRAARIARELAASSSLLAAVQAELREIAARKEGELAELQVFASSTERAPRSTPTRAPVTRPGAPRLAPQAADARLLAAVKRNPDSGRTTLLEASGLSGPQYAAALVRLLATKQVRRRGERRCATYRAR